MTKGDRRERDAAAPTVAPAEDRVFISGLVDKQGNIDKGISGFLVRPDFQKALIAYVNRQGKQEWKALARLLAEGAGDLGAAGLEELEYGMAFGGKTLWSNGTVKYSQRKSIGLSATFANAALAAFKPSPPTGTNSITETIKLVAGPRYTTAELFYSVSFLGGYYWFARGNARSANPSRGH